MKNFLQLRLNAGLWHEVMHHTSILNSSRQRAFAVGCGVAFFYMLLAVRLADVMVLKAPSSQRSNVVGEFDPIRYKRQDIVDRNGEVLATQIITASVYAEPKNILDAREAAEKLATVFPEVGFETLYNRLQQKKSFAWVARHVAPRAQEMIYKLGIPGVHLQRDYRRVYPHGDLCAHVLGGCDIDGNGHSGLELSFNDALTKMDAEKPLKISIDVRVQHIIADILAESIKEFQAVGGNVILMRIPDGQILSMVSMPSYDPNKPTPAGNAIFNRNTMGVYEPGSAFKILNTAIAIESGKLTPGMLFDARFPVKIGKSTVTDFRGACTFLTLEQAFVKSSNIASIMMVRLFGAQFQQECFKRFGVFEPVELELPEKSMPLYPDKWTDVTAWTASYGYGVAVAPIRTVATVASLLNDGWFVKPTLIHADESLGQAQVKALTQQQPIISSATSVRLRELMRMAVAGKLADVEGMDIMGKSGTTYKRVGSRGYGGDGSPRIATFVGGFPQHRPQYILYVALDEPKPQPHTHGFSTAGWNAAPTAGRIFKRLAGLLPIDMSGASTSPVKVSEEIQQPGGYVRQTTYVRQ